VSHMLRATSALLPSSGSVPLAPPSERAALWAAQAAQEIEHNFLCNVTKLPNEPADHPAASHISDLLLPPGTHLLLYGTSHIRSVRSVLVSVARYFDRDVTTELVSQSDDCDKNSSTPPPPMPAFHCACLSKARVPCTATESANEYYATCGLIETPCDSADLVIDTISSGSSSITTIANHAQYQLATNAHVLDSLLSARNFTHGYYWPPHWPAYFDSQCEKVQHGVPPDPTKVGDRVEHFCDLTDDACVAQSPLLRTIKRHVPNVGVKGGLALRRQDANAWWIPDARLSRGTGVDRVEARYHNDKLIARRRAAEYNVHACDVICAQQGHRPSRHGKVSCEPAEGTVLAWEVLRSAGLVECPSGWKGCDDLDSVKGSREPWRQRATVRRPEPYGATQDSQDGTPGAP